MTDEAHAIHQWLSGRFVRDIIGPAITRGASDTDLMVLFESCQTGTMLALAKHYSVPPAHVVAMMEASLQQAIVRFSEKVNANG